MPTWPYRLWNLLREPSHIPERLIDRRMRYRTRQFLRKRTDADNDRDRATVFKPFGDIRLLSAEARSVPTYQQVQLLQQGTSEKFQTALSQTSSLSDFATIYVLVRLLQPRVMVETGVFFGGFSAMILHAMKQNGFGKLYSIDLALDRDGLDPKLRGSLVPDELRKDWQLILGDSRVELPVLLQRLGQIDAFNHDSVHTTSFMSWEYETTWPYIRPGGFLSSHDVFMSLAWRRFLRRHRSEIDFSGHVSVLGCARKLA